MQVTLRRADRLTLLCLQRFRWRGPHRIQASQPAIYDRMSEASGVLLSAASGYNEHVYKYKNTQRYASSCVCVVGGGGGGGGIRGGMHAADVSFMIV